MVSEERGDLLLQQRLAFFGTVSASLSHEINNVLAIVNELNGLLEDLLIAAEGGGPLDGDRLRTIAEKTAAQVRRGQDLVRRLNRFAHAVDQPLAELDLGEVIELLVQLCQRFADLRRVRLVSRYPEERITIESSRFRILQALFICIDAALGAEGEDLEVTVALEPTGAGAGAGAEQGGARIVVASTGSIQLTDELRARLGYLRILADELGGELEAAPPADGKRMVLRLPRAPGPDTVGGRR